MEIIIHDKARDFISQKGHSSVYITLQTIST